LEKNTADKPVAVADIAKAESIKKRKLLMVAAANNDNDDNGGDDAPILNRRRKYKSSSSSNTRPSTRSRRNIVIPDDDDTHFTTDETEAERKRIDAIPADADGIVPDQDKDRRQYRSLRPDIRRTSSSVRFPEKA
jgi:hypothetical protein